MPLEYLFTGVSIKRPTSAKETIASNWRRISHRRIPSMAPSKKTFSRPVSSDETDADFEQAADSASNPGMTRSRLGDPRQDLQQGCLARPVRADNSQTFPTLDFERNIPECGDEPGSRQWSDRLEMYRDGEARAGCVSAEKPMPTQAPAKVSGRSSRRPIL